MGNGRDMYRVVLLVKSETDVQKVPLEKAYGSSARKPKKLVSAINKWLENTRNPAGSQ
jgi:hypothetical protein